MKCEMAKDNVILAYYGELPDELAGSLEQHLTTCEECQEELRSMQEMEAPLAMLPVVDASISGEVLARFWVTSSCSTCSTNGASACTNSR